MSLSTAATAMTVRPACPLSLRKLPSCRIDGELIADEVEHFGRVWSVQRALGSGKHDQVCVMAFDLLMLCNEDLRDLPLIERKGRLDELVHRAGVRCLGFIAAHPDGQELFKMTEMLELEGVVSKKAGCPYRFGRTGS